MMAIQSACFCVFNAYIEVKKGGAMLLKRTVTTFMLTSMVVMFMTVGAVFAAAPDIVAVVPGLAISGTAAVATDSLGYIYIADTGNNKVIMANAAGATTLTIGTGLAGFVPTAGSTGLNTTLADISIQFNAPAGIATDAYGNVYIADTGNHRIHMIVAEPASKLINATSRIITVAGNGIEGFSGDGAVATGASLKSPTGIAVDATGTLDTTGAYIATTGTIYIADNGNYRIRKVLPVKFSTTGITIGEMTAAGTISTIAGNGTATKLTAYGIALSPAPAGDLYIADAGNNRILKMTAAKGLPATFAGTGTAGSLGDGGLATLAQLNQPSGVTTNGKDLYIADTMNSSVRKISLSSGIISTRLGTVIQAAAVTAPAFFARPVSISVDAAGTVYVEDTGNSVIQQVFASVSAITTASPAGGTYAITQNVTLTPNKSAVITYNRSDDMAGFRPYTAPIMISGTTTLTFTSTDVDGNPEVINTATYIIDTAAPVTTAAINATPVNGIYYSALTALTVSLTSNEPTASIFYTTTGPVPTTASTKYSAPFSIPVTSTLTTTNVQYFALDLAGFKEGTQSRKYQVVELITTASPTGGFIPAARNVTLTANSAPATIYYTTDGSEPTAASAVYAAPIAIAIDTTLKYRAIDANGNLEQTKSQTYTLDASIPTVTASPLGGSFSIPQTITLTPNEQNATIYYTTTGIAPTTSSAKFNAPLTISKTTTLMYFAVDPAGNKGAVGTQIYTVDAVAPITSASILSGIYASVQAVKLTSDDTKATIYFTIDGTTPTSASTKYSKPILINSSTTLKYFAMDVLGNMEAVNTQEYTIITLTTSAAPKGGVFNSPQTVVLSTNDGGNAGTIIYYTVDGTTPSADTVISQTTKKYTTPLLLQDSTTTVLFFAVDANGVKENVKAEIYTVDSTAPTSVATCGTAANTITITATDPSPSGDQRLAPKIMYSTSNSVTHTGTPLAYFTEDITFTNNTIVKFFAVDVAGNTEAMKTAYCPVVTGPADADPALYLETLANGTTTSNSTLYVTGTVAPFATALTFNGNAPLSTNATDGSFTYLETVAALPGNNLITIAGTTTDTRNITAGATTTNLALGSSNGVIGNYVRIPITLTSGHQAAGVSIDIEYDEAKLFNPSVDLAKSAAALGKSIQGNSPSAGTYRILIMDANPPAPETTKLTPLPDGEIAYLTFTIPFSAPAGKVDLIVAPAGGYSATDLDAATMTVNNGFSGIVNIVSKAGNSIGVAPALGTDVALDLKSVQDALYMLLDPVTHPVDGSADLNADGTVEINELQQVINSFIGL